MKYKDSYDHQTYPDEYTAGQVIEQYIDNAPDYYDGELESLRRKVTVMSSVIGDIIEALPDHSAQLIISKLTRYEPILGS